MIGEIEQLCDKFGIDGMVMHASRTCRGMTNSQFLIAESAKRKGRQALFFEGDVADESFYKDELLNTRLEAMIESLQAQRHAAKSSRGFAWAVGVAFRWDGSGLDPSAVHVCRGRNERRVRATE